MKAGPPVQAALLFDPPVFLPVLLSATQEFWP
jgi:hypothetical protein